MTPHLFFVFAFGGLIIMVAMWLFQDVKYTEDRVGKAKVQDVEARVEADERRIEILELRMRESKKTLLKGLTK